MYINYNIVNGVEYGTLTSSVRKGIKVGKEIQIYLGRVIDKKMEIFKSRERGIFTYDISTDTYSAMPPEYEEPRIERATKYPKRPILIASFGAVFLLDEYLKILQWK